MRRYRGRSGQGLMGAEGDGQARPSNHLLQTGASMEMNQREEKRKHLMSGSYVDWLRDGSKRSHGKRGPSVRAVQSSSAKRGSVRAAGERLVDTGRWPSDPQTPDDTALRSSQRETSEGKQISGGGQVVTKMSKRSNSSFAPTMKNSGPRTEQGGLEGKKRRGSWEEEKTRRSGGKRIVCHRGEEWKGCGNCRKG